MFGWRSARKREWPYEYKAVFSPIDVIEEYIRPAVMFKTVKLLPKKPYQTPNLFILMNGTLERNSDGLRSLIDTMPNIPNMIEKTLRYPGVLNT